MTGNIPRILLVDDNRSIHEDFKQILNPPASARDAETRALENELFGSDTTQDEVAQMRYIIDDAYQGEEAIEMVEQAAQEGNSYSLVFMDVRMPPGLDGVQTILRIWENHPFVEMVICTAFSDYSWDEIVGKFGRTDHLLFLKKPFDGVALRQLTLSLTTKWEQDKRNREHLLELENQVRCRTRELRDMVQHLSQLKAQVESDMVAKSELLSNMSVEIKTPLNGIMGMTDLLLDTDLSTEQKNYAETIKLSSDSIYAIINDLFNFARLESGQIEIAAIGFDIRTAIENVAELVSIKARDNDTEVITLVHSDIPQMVVGDPERFRQLLITVAGGIVKSMPGGEVLITAFPDRVAGPSTADNSNSLWIKFEVSDTENRIPQQTRDELVGQITTGKTDRSGAPLGLSVASRLCILMGGSMSAEASDEKGLTVSFTVRFGCNGRADHHEIPALKSIEQTRILIIGDNPTSRKVLSLYIKHWGGKSSEARNAQEAIEMLHTTVGTIASFDMVIVDYRGGVLERYVQTAEQIKVHKNLNGIPLICLASMSKRGDAKALQDHGYFGYLTKPIKQTHLYNCIGMVKQIRDGKPIGYSGIITKHLIDELILDRYTVLVVESELRRLQSVVHVLEKMGIRCEVASESTEALRAVAGKTYDLIFLSCALRFNDGLELARSIRAREVGKRTTVIGLVWGSSDVNREACAAAGMDDCLVEPFNRESIQAMLKWYLGERETLSGVE